MRTIDLFRPLLSLLLVAFASVLLNAQDTTRSVDRLRPVDLGLEVTRQDSLPAALKNSEIIPNPEAALAIWYIQSAAILKNGKHDLFFGVDQIYSDRQELPVKQGKQKQSRPIWVLFVVIFLFLIAGILRVAFPVELRTIMDAYYKERLLLQVSKEDNLATSWPYIFLYALFSLSLGLFVVIVLSSFGESKYLSFENFLKNSLLVALLFIAKILIIRFISFVFLLDRIVREYIAVLYLVYFNSMFCLMPFLLAAVFVPSSYIRFLLLIYVVLVVLLFAYRFLRTAFHLFTNFKFSIFYLILYLCTLELAPILILVRALNN